MKIETLNNMIADLENSEESLSNIRNLSALYMVRNNINVDKVTNELNDVLPSYMQYVKIKREYQMGETSKEKIASYCGNIDCEFLFDKVEYCSQNRIDRMQAFNTSSAERFLYKNEDLAYQHEYRMVLPIEIPADHYIRIGKLENAKVVPSSMLQNLVFSISYTSL